MTAETDISSSHTSTKTAASRRCRCRNSWCTSSKNSPELRPRPVAGSSAGRALCGAFQHNGCFICCSALPPSVVRTKRRCRQLLYFPTCSDFCRKKRDCRFRVFGSSRDACPSADAIHVLLRK